jgi:UDP-N-acetylmuramoyl-L-alanyl-D-glutamate--2,6-diaminopimelate ligase
MKPLSELLKAIAFIRCWGDTGVEISGIRYDSRRVEANDCFIAITGFKDDGMRYVSEAVTRGARAVVSESTPDGLPSFKAIRDRVAWIQVARARRAMSRLASEFYGNPTRDMSVVGVTGTNGKTTVVALIDAILSQVAGSAKIGTLGMEYTPPSPGQGVYVKTQLTSPEAPDLFGFLATVRDAGCRNLAMEVSSVALALHRVDAIGFSQGVFTTFSGDHLDFHKTMEDYFESKLTLFTGLKEDGWAILNRDDPMMDRILSAINCRHLTYGFSPEADVRPLKYSLSLDGMRAHISTPKGDIEIESRLIGRLNLLNIMAALASVVVRYVPFETIRRAVAGFRPVKGRLDFSYSNDFSVLIDYAHTDKALETLLQSLKEIVRGRIILIFGAGGSRDVTKRPRMGEVASRFADFVVVTSDNPREEEPGRIVDHIISGFVPGFSDYEVVVDREHAIRRGLKMAARGDLVVIAGKGHEDYQIFKDKVIHFDDYEVVNRIIQEKNPGGVRSGRRSTARDVGGGSRA